MKKVRTLVNVQFSIIFHCHDLTSFFSNFMLISRVLLSFDEFFLFACKYGTILKIRQNSNRVCSAGGGNKTNSTGVWIRSECILL